MRNRIEVYEHELVNNQMINTLSDLHKSPVELNEKNLVFEILAAEGCEDVVNYIEWLGLDKDPDLLVLPSMHHYYYDAEEMKNVKTVVNLKELNLIKNIDSFLHSIFHILQPKSNLIGCFAEKNKHLEFLNNKGSSLKISRTHNEALENGIVSRFSFLNMIYKIVDSRTNRYMTRRDVYQLFETHGFKIMDLTEINGLTYFLAQKIRTADN